MYPYFQAQTLDDALRAIVEDLLAHGDAVTARRGHTRERTGVLLEITNPRARLSLTETRGQLFTCLAEFCWYLSQQRDLQSIAYYIPKYQEEAEGDIIFGGYGPRLFDWDGINQVTNVISLLRDHPTSRRAVIQLFDRGDIAAEHTNIPCTCVLQFIVRHSTLHMVTYMRSNDAYLGLPHDVFAFTMLQELMARSLALDLGTYKHAVGSLHLYGDDRKRARSFLREGWQSTQLTMAPMPDGDPWPSITVLIGAEAAIRTKEPSAADILDRLDPYWADLIRLLQIFRCWSDRDTNGMKAIRAEMSSPFYLPFIDRQVRRVPRAR